MSIGEVLLMAVRHEVFDAELLATWCVETAPEIVAIVNAFPEHFVLAEGIAERDPRRRVWEVHRPAELRQLATSMLESSDGPPSPSRAERSYREQVTEQRTVWAEQKLIACADVADRAQREAMSHEALDLLYTSVSERLGVPRTWWGTDEIDLHELPPRLAFDITLAHLSRHEARGVPTPVPLSEETRYALSFAGTEVSLRSEALLNRFAELAQTPPENRSSRDEVAPPRELASLNGQGRALIRQGRAAVIPSQWQGEQESRDHLRRA